MKKSFRKSVTIGGIVLIALIGTLQGQGVLPEGSEEGVVNLVNSLGDVIQALAGLAVIYGRVRASGPLGL